MGPNEVLNAAFFAVVGAVISSILPPLTVHLFKKRDRGGYSGTRYAIMFLLAANSFWVMTEAISMFAGGSFDTDHISSAIFYAIFLISSAMLFATGLYFLEEGDEIDRHKEIIRQGILFLLLGNLAWVATALPAIPYIPKVVGYLGAIIALGLFARGCWLVWNFSADDENDRAVKVDKAA